MTEGPSSKKASSSGGEFFGWWIIAGGTAILFVSSGIGFYGHGVILDPLRAQYGWSKGLVSMAVSMYFMVTGVMGMIIGKFIDQYGPKPALVVGSIVIGIGFFLLSRVTQLWQFFAVYLLMAIGWSGTSLVPINTLIANWFIRRRGFAMAMTMTGLSLGGMVLVPFAVYLISHWGLRTALPIQGLMFWVIIIPIALLVIKPRPSDLGQFPDGVDPAISVSGKKSTDGLSLGSQWQVWTRSMAMKTLAFWSIVVAFILAMGGQNAFLVHQISFLSQTLGSTGAALAVSVTTAASIFGRLFLGPIADQVDKRVVALCCFFAQGAALLALAFFRQVVVLYLGTFAFGLTMGGVVMMQSLLIGECFGLVSFGTISGLSGLFTMLIASLGPATAGWIFDVFHDYWPAFTLFALADGLAMIMILFARPPKRII